MLGFGLHILELAVFFYLLLAIGINLIACLAPVPRKPLLNVALLGVIVIGFLSAVTRLVVESVRS